MSTSNNWTLPLECVFLMLISKRACLCGYFVPMWVCMLGISSQRCGWVVKSRYCLFQCPSWSWLWLSLHCNYLFSFSVLLKQLGRRWSWSMACFFVHYHHRHHHYYHYHIEDFRPEWYISTIIHEGFLTRMVYLKHDIWWRYTILVGNPRYSLDIYHSGWKPSIIFIIIIIVITSIIQFC